MAGVTLDSWKMKTLKKVLFMKAKIKEEWVNKKKTKIYWLIEMKPKHVAGLTKQLGGYDSMVGAVFSDKTIKKFIRKLADSPEVYEDMKEMVKSGTKVRRIFRKEENEVVDTVANKTFWERMKEKFTKKEVDEDDIKDTTKNN